MKITPERTVGSIVAEDYRAAAVLTKYGIDFCCKGGRSVQEVCANKNIDQNQLAEDITKLLARDAKSGEDARTWPLDQLADHVETVHHRYVEERGPIIQQYLAKLCKVHGERHPELFTLYDEFNACVGAMAAHMKKEELVLFPFVRNLARSERSGEAFKVPHFGTVENPVNMMMEDHNAEGERFERMKAVSDGFTMPTDGCATYATAFNMLKEFEEDLHLHIHLENNIMFPRAIALEKSLAHAAN
ncbi:MAG: iron-sulfur cluster repair di-iron protein [Flavobacteriales bacterium]|jgi:regulator of cell morphogenesis and NO signaling|nr:iron-sulfur cluster repair di-iron protein [Flavobacteriales bacterium]MCB0757416.1 iron-sulfur cluster repair di-iron protein [Flavobacteriales bacterium]